MAFRRWRYKMRVVEAAGALLVAQVLIRNVRFGIWRHWLGRIDVSVDENAVVMIDMELVGAVTRAVRHVARRGRYRCLAQAMATQWMLRRRGLSSRLVFGVEARPASGSDRELHAWVQIGSRTVMGADPTRSYRPTLALAQIAQAR